MTTFGKPSEFESVPMTELREMSEDPVKHEPLGVRGPSAADKDQWERDARASVLDREPTVQQIRIEALRAAAQITAAAIADGRGDSPAEPTLDIAKQFAAYLESGE